MLLTALVLAVIPPAQGVYWARAEVLLVPPNSANFGNGLRADSGEGVMFAAAVEREFNGRQAAVRAASDEATLYGMGVRQGVTVSLPNAGGQWQSSFNRSVLVVQVVGRSEQEARTELADTLARLTALIRSIQDGAGVPPVAMVRSAVSPSRPGVSYISGSRKREVAADGLLGLGLSAAAAVAWSRRRARRT